MALVNSGKNWGVNDRGNGKASRKLQKPHRLIESPVDTISVHQARGQERRFQHAQFVIDSK
jgi:hypothetical protein